MMTTKTQTPANPLAEIAERIREMREIIGYSPAQMAERTEVTEELYRSYETGTVDLPFTFLHKCAVAFGMELTDLLAREAIRDLVARYNAYGDSGLLDRMIELFAEDAVLEEGDDRYEGRDAIRGLFSGTVERSAGARHA